jgi:hypothetical protein
MDRRKTMVAAAAVAGTLLAASSAYALTSGALDGGRGDGAGKLTPVVEQQVGDRQTTTTSRTGDDRHDRRADDQENDDHEREGREADD